MLDLDNSQVKPNPASKCFSIVRIVRSKWTFRCVTAQCMARQDKETRLHLQGSDKSHSSKGEAEASADPATGADGDMACLRGADAAGANRRSSDESAGLRSGCSAGDRSSGTGRDGHEANRAGRPSASCEANLRDSDGSADDNGRARAGDGLANRVGARNDRSSLDSHSCVDRSQRCGSRGAGSEVAGDRRASRDDRVGRSVRSADALEEYDSLRDHLG